MKSYIVKNGILEKYRGNAAHAVIPSNIREIGHWVFTDCPNLTSIKIPNRLTFIGYYAFDGAPQVKPQYTPNGALRAFKGFNKDWTCRGFKYAVGHSYHIDGEIEICINGFHACLNPLNVFNYYAGKLSTLRFAEVELSGKMDGLRDKIAASDIKIVRELTVQELFDIYNSMEKC